MENPVYEERRQFLRTAAVVGGGAAVGIVPTLAGCGAEAQGASPASVRFPEPLRPGAIIGITSPSAGVKSVLRPRMQFAYQTLRGLGYVCQEGQCLWGETLQSAPARDRAAELQRMLLDPAIAAVFPPDGGELLIDILPFIDFEALGRARPKWIIGYSDLSTFMLPYALRTGIASLSGTNVWESPIYPTDPNLAYWHAVATLAPGSAFDQRAAALYQPHDSDWDKLPPETRQFDRTAPVRWKCLSHEDDPAYAVAASGRLIGGTLDVVAMLCGSEYGDVAGFARSYAPEGLLVYLDSCDFNTAQYCRALHLLRLAGWFDAAKAVLVGRTAAETVEGFTPRDALLDALGGLSVPVIYDMDIGHLPPQLMLVNGAAATLTFGPTEKAMRQTLA